MASVWTRDVGFNRDKIEEIELLCHFHHFFRFAKNRSDDCKFFEVDLGTNFSAPPVDSWVGEAHFIYRAARDQTHARPGFPPSQVAGTRVASQRLNYDSKKLWLYETEP